MLSGLQAPSKKTKKLTVTLARFGGEYTVSGRAVRFDDVRAKGELSDG